MFRELDIRTTLITGNDKQGNVYHLIKCAHPVQSTRYHITLNNWITRTYHDVGEATETFLYLLNGGK